MDQLFLLSLTADTANSPKHTSPLFLTGSPECSVYQMHLQANRFLSKYYHHMCSRNNHFLSPFLTSCEFRQSAAFQSHIPGNVPTHQRTHATLRASLLCWVKVSSSLIHLGKVFLRLLPLLYMLNPLEKVPEALPSLVLP